MAKSRKITRVERGRELMRLIKQRIKATPEAKRYCAVDCLCARNVSCTGSELVVDLVSEAGFDVA